MNFAKRIIPCLDIKNGRVVKGVNFVGLVDAGDPVEVAKRYNDNGADEITFLDIMASFEGRGALLDMIKAVAKEVFIPLTIGGGIKSIKDMGEILGAGCDKISINSAALKNPALIEEGAKKYGSQCVVVAIDAKRESNGQYGVYLNGGRVNAQKELLSWAKEAESRGAGEILLTSMDTDGTKEGYDCDMLRAINEVVKIPVIASGGAGKMEHMLDAFKSGADAALAASIFHFGEIEINALKSYLAKNGISVRI